MAIAEAAQPPTSGAPDVPASARASGEHRLLAYNPALDGVRGLAVAAVLVFHAGFSWAKGGYLGVSTFFTLSGFLITRLLLAERERSGTVDLRSFWKRRFRRLMPASLAALGLICAFGVFAADATQAADLRGDIYAALAYVANWRFILDDASYADLFGNPSPVLHFWSLAIEEQFYLLYPLLAFGVLAAAGRSGVDHATARRRFTIALGTLTVISAVLASSGIFDDDRVYFGTDTRAAELLMGALLAVVVTSPRFAERLDAQPGLRSGISAAGAVALVVTFALWATTPQTADWLYSGGFPAYSILSAVVILACVVPGPVATGLSVAPLRSLGLVSYGVYLYHWPIFLWLDQKTDYEGGVLFFLQLALTANVAIASYFFLEMPVRRRGMLAGIRSWKLAPPAIATVVLLAVVATANPPAPAIDFEAAEAAVSDAPPVPDLDDPRGSPVPRIAIYGDSTALAMALGFNEWLRDTGLGEEAVGHTGFGCPVGRGGEWRRVGEPSKVEETCHWDLSWARQTLSQHPDVALVLTGTWDVADRKLPGSDEWVSIGDPDYDEWLFAELLGATDTLAQEGAEVIWLTNPTINRDLAPDDLGTSAEPERMARYNELLFEVVAQRPGVAHVIDLATFVEKSGNDAEWRPDGVHFDGPGGKAVGERFVGPELLRIYNEERGF